jgi:hypothetical protein
MLEMRPRKGEATLLLLLSCCSLPAAGAVPGGRGRATSGVLLLSSCSLVRRSPGAAGELPNREPSESLGTGRTAAAVLLLLLLAPAAEPAAAAAAALASATAAAAGVCLYPLLYLSCSVGMPMTLLAAVDLALLLLPPGAAVSADRRSARGPPARCPTGATGLSFVGLPAPPAANPGPLLLLPNAPAADGSERVAARIAAVPGLLAGLLAPGRRLAGLALRLAAAVLLLLLPLLAPVSEPRSLAMWRLCAEVLLASTLLVLALTLLPGVAPALAPPAAAAERAAGLGVLLRWAAAALAWC